MKKKKPKYIKYGLFNAHKVLKFLGHKKVKRRKFVKNHNTVREQFPGIEYGYYIITNIEGKESPYGQIFRVCNQEIFKQYYR